MCVFLRCLNYNRKIITSGWQNYKDTFSRERAFAYIGSELTPYTHLRTGVRDIEVQGPALQRANRRGHICQCFGQQLLLARFFPPLGHIVFYMTLSNVGLRTSAQSSGTVVVREEIIETETIPRQPPPTTRFQPAWTTANEGFKTSHTYTQNKNLFECSG